METQDLALLRPSALNLRQLSLVEWLLSAPLGTRRFLVESPMHLKFCETGERLANGMLSVKITLPNDYGAPAKELRDFFGGKVVVSLEPLVAAGLLVLFPSRARSSSERVTFEDRTADISIPGNWSIHSRCYEIAGPSVAEWYESKGRSRREKLLSVASAKIASVTRRAVFGRTVNVRPAMDPGLASMLPEYYRFELPSQTVLRPCAVATIVDETDKRFKVRDIVSLNGNPVNWLGLRIRNDDFFEREYLMLDNAGEREIELLRQMDAEYVEELNAIAASIYAEIVPVIARMADRLKQKQAQHEDLISETLQSLLAERNMGSGS